MKISLIIVFMFFVVGTAWPAALGNWTEYETINDNGGNAIDFTWKRDCKRLDDKACLISWKWRNRYQGQVRGTYRITYSDAEGNQALQRDVVLQPGESQDEFLTGDVISLVQFGVEKSDIRNLAIKTFDVAEEELKADQKQALRQERDRQLQSSEEDIKRSLNYQRIENERNQSIQDQATQRNNAAMRQLDNNFKQNMANLAANTSANYAAIGNQMAQVDREVNTELQRRKDEAERRRQDDERSRKQQHANQQRQQEANRQAERQRVAQLEQQRRDQLIREQQAEQRRQEQERQAREKNAKLEADQRKREADQQKIAAARQNFKPLGQCNTNHTEAFRRNYGSVSLLGCVEGDKFMGEQGVKWAISNNSADTLRITFQKRYIFSCRKEEFSNADIELKPYETINAGFFAGHLDLADPLYPGQVCGIKNSTVYQVGVNNFSSEVQ